MSRGVCPRDGTRLVFVSSANGLGDDIHRWECPLGDWDGPWYAGGSTGGDHLPELSRQTMMVTVQSDQLADMADGSDTETRLDFDGRTDNQPVYLGRAAPGTPTADPGWEIEKVTYDGDGRPVRKQVLTGSWDSRAALAW